MFQKVLIADDHATTSSGVKNLLKSLGIKNVEVAFYCDDAHLKIRKANDILNEPFDLVITDLSFKEDYHNRDLKRGEDLVKKLRSLYTDIGIIVYSMEDHFQKVRELIQELGANAYVCKSRRSDRELEEAIKSVYEKKTYLSKDVENALHNYSRSELTTYEKAVVKLLSQGLSQPDISSYLKKFNISPSSLSSIEKTMNRLKDQFNASNAVHLVSILKDLRLI
jgi:DNA-binding NarL/FixJ family response regulator